MGTAHAGTAGNPAPVMALAPLDGIEAHCDVYLPNGLADRRHCAARAGLTLLEGLWRAVTQRSLLVRS